MRTPKSLACHCQERVLQKIATNISPASLSCADWSIPQASQQARFAFPQPGLQQGNQTAQPLNSGGDTQQHHYSSWPGSGNNNAPLQTSSWNGPSTGWQLQTQQSPGQYSQPQHSQPQQQAAQAQNYHQSASPQAQQNISYAYLPQQQGGYPQQPQNFHSQQGSGFPYNQQQSNIPQWQTPSAQVSQPQASQVSSQQQSQGPQPWPPSSNQSQSTAPAHARQPSGELGNNSLCFRFISTWHCPTKESSIPYSVERAFPRYHMLSPKGH